jgi:hypothetical protein
MNAQFRRAFAGTALAAVALLATAQPAVYAAGAADGAPKGKRPLNIAQFDPAIRTISAARAAELDAALTRATIPQV